MGERILIRGDNLGETTEVTLNGIPARFEVHGDIDPRKHFVLLWVPENATTGLLTLTTPHGSFTTAEPFVLEDGRPVIESFSPTSGPAGTFIQIHGKNLKYATSVQLNGQEIVWGVGIDPINIYLTARVPVTATSGPITVTSPHGTFTSQASFTVTAPPPLTVQGWPEELEAGMPWILQVNDNFLVQDVQLNGTSIPVVGMASTDLIILVPTNGISGPLTIVTANETVTSPQPLIVHPKPLLTGVRPKSGPPGTVVQLVGRGFQNVSEVWLGNTPVAFDKETLTFSVPSGAKGGLLSLRTRFYGTDSQVEFAVTSGRILTGIGSISGSVPQAEPRPVTGITPAVGERLPSGLESYVLSSWPLMGVPSYVSTLPALEISSNPGNTLKLSWPADAPEYVLEMSQELAPGDWRAAGQTPIVNNGVNELVVPMSADQYFFRLTPLQAGQR